MKNKSPERRKYRKTAARSAAVAAVGMGIVFVSAAASADSSPVRIWTADSALDGCAWLQAEKAENADSQRLDEPVNAWETFGKIAGGQEALLPYYSSVDEGRKPTVKSQGSYGTCWALAATSALEASLLPEQPAVFSADHMALNNAFSVPVNDGGDYLMTMAYLSGWQGPVLEYEDPYGDGFSPKGLEPAVHVQEMQLYGGASEREMKTAIRRYGVLQTSLFLNRETVSADAGCYNERQKTYYDPEEQIQNHDIIILGWDDRISRFLFAQIPPEDGAWICQNSWGSEFGNDGLFYVSYADPNIGRAAIAYTEIEPTGNYDRIYQTDSCGWQGSQGYGDDVCWFANRYQTEQCEKLAAVGFYATGADTSYQIYLEKNDGGQETDRVFLKAGVLERPGYYTIDLDQDVQLGRNKTFTVAVRIQTPDSRNPVAVEYHAGTYTETVTTEGKYGYLSHDGKSWVHTEKKYGTNVCLKAYTKGEEK